MQKGGETKTQRSKKFIIAAVLAGVVLVGTIGATVFANDDGDSNQPGALFGALWDRVCAIYEDNTGTAIEPEALKDAFAQAQNEMRIEAMENRLQNLVDESKITQDEADQYKEWWQSKPDVPFGPGLRGPGGFRGFGSLCVPPGGA